MNKNLIPILAGPNLDEEADLDLAEISRACRVHAERIMELVEEGILEPRVRGRDPMRWRFSGASLRRARKAVHLQYDLGINLPGVALALELLDEIERLRRQVRKLEW